MWPGSEGDLFCVMVQDRSGAGLSLSLSEVMRRRGGSLLCPGSNYDNKRKQSYYWRWAFIMQMILKQAAWMASGYRLISMQ